MKWTDATSYSRDDRERVPKTWELAVTQEFRIAVTRHIHYGDDTWLLLCHALGILHTPCPSADLEDCKAWAVAKVRARLRAWSRALDQLETAAKPEEPTNG